MCFGVMLSYMQSIVYLFPFGPFEPPYTGLSLPAFGYLTLNFLAWISGNHFKFMMPPLWISLYPSRCMGASQNSGGPLFCGMGTGTQPFWNIIIMVPRVGPTPFGHLHSSVGDFCVRPPCNASLWIGLMGGRACSLNSGSSFGLPAANHTLLWLSRNHLSPT